MHLICVVPNFKDTVAATFNSIGADMERAYSKKK